MSQRDGFTLIELLIVVMIIGILAAVALPKFSRAREQAFYSALKQDLRHIAHQQEIYYARTLQYTNSQADLGLSSSEFVVLGTIALGTGNQGWAASATHSRIAGSGKGCAIYNGDAVAAPTSPVEPPKRGVVACSD